MSNLAKQPSNRQKLSHLLHKHVISEQFNYQSPISPKLFDKQQAPKESRFLVFPQISPHKNNSYRITGNQRLTSRITRNLNTQQYTHKQSNSCLTSGQELIQVNKQILKRIDQKIYPMNKDISNKLKLRKNLSCQTLQNSCQQTQLYVGKSVKKSKKKKVKQGTDQILDEKLEKTNRSKRTKSQQEIIELQAKVECYLRDKRKQLKVKYDDEKMQSLLRKQLSQPIFKQSRNNKLKQEQKESNSQYQKTKSSLKKSKLKIQVDTSVIEKQSELKRVIKMFQQRTNNFTTLETQRQKQNYKQIKYMAIEKDKSMKIMDCSDLSKSLRIICNSVNKKCDSLKKLQDITLKEINPFVKKVNTKDNSLKQSIKANPQTTLNSLQISSKALNKTNLSKVTSRKQNLMQVQQSLRAVHNGQTDRLNKQLMKLMKQQLLDEKNNLMRKKLNHGKLIKIKKTQIIGIPTN